MLRVIFESSRLAEQVGQQAHLPVVRGDDADVPRLKVPTLQKPLDHAHDPCRLVHVLLRRAVLRVPLGPVDGHERHRVLPVGPQESGWGRPVLGRHTVLDAPVVVAG